MKKRYDYSDYIEKYLEGNMDSKELKWFRSEISSNPDLAREIQLNKEVSKALNEKEVIDLRERLENIHETISADSIPYERRFIRNKVLWASVASVAVLITLSLMAYFLMFRTYSNEKLFNRYYEKYEVSSLVRSGNSDPNDIFSQAMSMYNKKEYINAVILFEKVLAIDSLNMTANMSLGISKIETSNPDDAKRPFERIIDHNDNLYVEQAEWYLALCYLVTNNTTRAKDLFEKINNNKSYNNKEAREILQNLVHEKE